MRMGNFTSWFFLFDPSVRLGIVSYALHINSLVLMTGLIIYMS